MAKKKKLLIFIILFLLFLIIGFIAYGHYVNPFEIIRHKRYTQPTALILSQPLDRDAVTCEFKVTSDFHYENGRKPWDSKDRTVYYKTVEDSPTIISFSALASDTPQIKGNVGIGSLIKIKDDKETIVLLEKNLVGDIFMYTIFKEDKIAVWSKGYRLLGNPWAMLSMGYCY